MQQLEGKVATLTVINGALQKENDSLRKVRAPRSILTSRTRSALPSAALKLLYQPRPARSFHRHRMQACGGPARHMSPASCGDSASRPCAGSQARAAQKHHGGTCSAQEASNGAGDAAELAELQEEFQRRLGAADRTIAQLKVRQRQTRVLIIRTCVSGMTHGNVVSLQETSAVADSRNMVPLQWNWRARTATDSGA